MLVSFTSVRCLEESACRFYYLQALFLLENITCRILYFIPLFLCQNNTLSPLCCYLKLYFLVSNLGVTSGADTLF